MNNNVKEQLINAFVEKSDVKNFPACMDEWQETKQKDLCDYETWDTKYKDQEFYYKNKKYINVCECGKPYLRYISIWENVNNNVLIVGSCCVKKLVKEHAKFEISNNLHNEKKRCVELVGKLDNYEEFEILIEPNMFIQCGNKYRVQTRGKNAIKLIERFKFIYEGSNVKLPFSEYKENYYIFLSFVKEDKKIKLSDDKLQIKFNKNNNFINAFIA